MTDPFDWHRRALAGESPPIHEGEPQVGFYRKRHTMRGEKGQRIKGPWEPASIFASDDGGLIAEINGRPVNAVEAWSWFAKNPITEKAYRYHVEHGRWQDDPLPEEASDNPLVKIGGNYPPAESDDPELDSLLSEVEQCRLAGSEVYRKLVADAPKVVCDKAQNIRERLKSLSKRINDLRVARKAPYLQAERDIDSYFRAAIALPLSFEAVLAPRVTAWLRADRDRREAEEQERMRSAVTASPPPEVTKVGGAIGRKAKLRTVVTAVIVDQDAVYKFFRDNGELKALLQKLADAGIKFGPVPGCTQNRQEVS